MVKMTGSEWNRFYRESWPEGYWHEGEEMTMDGEELTADFDLADVPDSAVIRLSGGTVYVTDDGEEGPSLEAYFKQWRKRQNTTVLVVEAPKEAADAVRAAIAAAGGKVKG